MATALSNTTSFTGLEDPYKRGEEIRMTSELFGFEPSDTLKLALLSTKGSARDWALELRKAVPELTAEDLITRAKDRFLGPSQTDKLYEKFTSRKICQTGEDYQTMLKEASTLASRNCLSTDLLQKEVIKKAPEKIQAILYGLSTSEINWATFLSRAGEVTWLAQMNLAYSSPSALPTTPALCPIGRPRPNSRKLLRTGKFFCKLHKENNSHLTESCRLLAQIKALGLTVNSVAQDDEAEDSFNKDIKSNSNYSSLSSMANPFYKPIKLKGSQHTHTALFDTGADVSIINQKHVPAGAQIKEIQTSLRAANGTSIQIKREATGLAAEVDYIPFKFDPLIVESKPKYTIIGAETLQRNPELLYKMSDWAQPSPQS